jgi:hypothetical protein
MFAGEHIGGGTPPAVDIAVDPLDGTTLTAQGRSGAIAVSPPLIPAPHPPLLLLLPHPPPPLSLTPSSPSRPLPLSPHDATTLTAQAV